jgi:hypothetical protein
MATAKIKKKKAKTRDEIIESLKSAEGEEGRTGLVEAFLAAEKKSEK